MRTSGVVVAFAFALATGAAGLRAQSGGSALEDAARLVRERKWVEAQHAVEPLARSEPKNAAAQYWLGRSLAGQRDADGARAAFERAVQLAPSSSEYHLWLGRTYGEQAMHASVFSRLSLARKTRAEFERAVALDPGSFDAHAALMSYHLRAPGIAGGSRETALSEARTLKRLDPYRGSIQLEQALQSMRRTDEAIAEMQALAAAYPDSASPVTQLAALYGEGKDWDRAFAMLDAFLRRRPRHPAALYALGRLAAISGQRLDEGEGALREYLARGPEPGLPAGSPHWRLGMILQQRGRLDDARREYETAVRLNPDNPQFRKSLDALRR